ncbi:hypothetical protein LO80_07290 [Candidatus Francisella endociliophora]|uniref:LysM domain-containing protein n=1 Tax=Candidatus Francisella endociliophora TaxID=653937 RepID=A0A097EQE4_9GAMM|nr:hypothetical protein [Francisella sp. FSC1006]AIT09790.1 hypothetical protein LO80_07290 [Francisella sp. FSC1006]
MKKIILATGMIVASVASSFAAESFTVQPGDTCQGLANVFSQKCASIEFIAKDSKGITPVCSWNGEQGWHPVNGGLISGDTDWWSCAG